MSNRLYLNSRTTEAKFDELAKAINSVDTSLGFYSLGCFLFVLLQKICQSQRLIYSKKHEQGCLTPSRFACSFGNLVAFGSSSLNALVPPMFFKLKLITDSNLAALSISTGFELVPH